MQEVMCPPATDSVLRHRLQRSGGFRAIQFHELQLSAQFQNPVRSQFRFENHGSFPPAGFHLETLAGGAVLEFGQRVRPGRSAYLRQLAAGQLENDRRRVPIDH